jgi:hypothetical protein
MISALLIVTVLPLMSVNPRSRKACVVQAIGACPAALEPRQAKVTKAKQIEKNTYRCLTKYLLLYKMFTVLLYQSRSVPGLSHLIVPKKTTLFPSPPLVTVFDSQLLEFSTSTLSTLF